MALNKTFLLEIDIGKVGANMQPTIKKSETGTVFSVTVTLNGTAVNLTGITTNKLNIKKPDLTTATVTGSTVDLANGKVKFEFAGSEIAQTGLYYAELEFADATDSIKSRMFSFVVEDNIL